MCVSLVVNILTAALLLIRCGDVETNPGPMNGERVSTIKTRSCDQNDTAVKLLNAHCHGYLDACNNTACVLITALYVCSSSFWFSTVILQL